jgi:hypothetical protein
MKKKIFGIFVAALALAMLALFVVPVMAKQAGTEVTYYSLVPPTGMTYPKVLFCGDSGNNLIKSHYEGTIFADQTKTIPLFDFVQDGKVRTQSTGDQVWHFKQVWTKIGDPDSGFEGSLNGKGYLIDPNAFPPSEYTVSGILNGFGEYNGQKLVLEYSWSDFCISGILVTK